MQPAFDRRGQRCVQGIMAQHGFSRFKLQRLLALFLPLPMRPDFVLLLLRSKSGLAFHKDRLGRFVKYGGKRFAGTMQLATNRIG